MKKITILIAFVLATSAFGQKDSKDYKFFEESTEKKGTQDVGDDFPGAPGAEPTPINDYIPALAVVGLGMAVYFSRKKYSVVK